MTKHRLQLDFTEEAFKELVELQAESGMPSKAELFRQALKLMSWAVEVVHKGQHLLIRLDDGSLHDVEFPWEVK